MSKKSDLQEALVEGATRGLVGKQLYEFVRGEVPSAKNKKVVSAAFMALSDPDLRDRHVLDAIYSLALQRRLADDEDDASVESKRATLPLKPTKGRRK